MKDKQHKLKPVEVQFILWLRNQAMLADALKRVQIRQEWQEDQIGDLRREFRDLLRVLMSAADPEFKAYQQALRDSRFNVPTSPDEDVRPD